jgi:hypothetical protein
MGAMLRAAMESAFGGSDTEGVWEGKAAYDACEAATVLFPRKFGPAMRARSASPAVFLPMLTSALSCLAEGGRLVAITGASCAPDNLTWTDPFVRLQRA